MFGLGVVAGHHSPFPFGPNAWRRMGASCLLALLELDFLAKPRRSLCPSLPAFHARYREGLWALRQLEGRQSARAEGKCIVDSRVTFVHSSAAVAYGVQYAPVKKYEIYDGITFQWFMCAGILMLRRVLLYLQCPWSMFSNPGFEMLKKIAEMVPEDVTLVSARLSNFIPLPENSPMGKFWTHEVHAGRLIDFTKYRAPMLFLEDGQIIAVRVNIAHMEEDCLRREVVRLWSDVPRNSSTGFVLGNDNECLLIVFGGALWALSNYLVLPLVKLLGIGLGFSLYHFVNLMVGYVVGRFGFFQMERLKGDLMVCDP
eukprot:g19042.t1